MIQLINQRKACKLAILVLLMSIISCSSQKQHNYSTNYFKINIDEQGFINSMQTLTVTPHREFSPIDKPSPLMCLYNSKEKKYYKPQSATFNKKEDKITLSYSNGSTAEIAIQPKDKYIKLTLLSLSNRENIDDIQWGSYHTKITNLFGEIIGVARDTTATVNYAIGVLALNDITTGGTSDTKGDAAPFQYIIHSPDAEKFPLPNDLHEGQLFPIGGDGISDVAFYSHKEAYYRIVYGKSAFIDEQGRAYITYHASDRTKEKNINFSLIPFLETHKPNHIKVEAIPGVDFIGSSIALWGSPDDTALLDVVQDVVLSEGLPYPKKDGKWVKNPNGFAPDVVTYGGLYDSIISYTSQMGIKTISLYDQGFLRPDRGNEGYIDGKDFAKKPIKLSSGNVSHKEFSKMAAKHGITIGRTTITNALAPGTKDASPIPSNNLCYQQNRLLAKSISPTDTIIIVDDPTYFEEIAGWEGHAEDLNIIKIGDELIHYLGVSKKAPFTLQNVKRGYWSTKPSSHLASTPIYKLQVTCGGGYTGLIPNIYLQDKIAEYYADICQINGLGFYDFDGQEFLFNNGHGYYSAKRFFGKMFERAEELSIPHIRFTGATLSEGSWHYQSIWNVGGGKNLYDVETREWGSTTSQGKDLRDVSYANFFPVGMGTNFSIMANSTVEQYEHIQAISVGLGTTYGLHISQKDVESCPQKGAIFKVIRTWEDARAANAFPLSIRKKLADPEKSWTLKNGEDTDSWILYEKVNDEKINPITLKRAEGY